MALAAFAPPPRHDGYTDDHDVAASVKTPDGGNAAMGAGTTTTATATTASLR
jgi:hypothetical protein